MTAAADFSFPRELVTFLQDLSANNSRDWFKANKATYEQAYKASAAAFCGLMSAELEKLSGTPHSSKIFRINRDVRFAKDKTPYNTHLHISFFQQNPTALTPHWFFGLQVDSVTVGAGIFAFDTNDLERYRQQVAGARGNELADLLATLASRGVRMDEPELKRVPAGYPADHPNGMLLRRKGLAVWRDLGGSEVATQRNIVETVRTSLEELKPVCNWLQKLEA